MNSRKPQDDALDLSLRRSLQNWATRQQPPMGGRARLLQAAGQTPKLKRKKFAIPTLMFLQFQDLPMIRTSDLSVPRHLVLSQGFDTWQVHFQVSQAFTARLVG
ncbi:MAG: hypothetical protein JW862_08775 [Anaerolineales bacterium]|nr:hypothetical protein [Anaerolineales bacterium]